MKLLGKFIVVIFILLGVGTVYWKISSLPKNSQSTNTNYKLDSVAGKIEYPTPTSKPYPSFVPPKTASISKTWSTTTPTVVPTQDNQEWGKATQLSEHTWTMKVGFDDTMATPQEIFEALNKYRQQHSREALTWDDRLANFAKERASTFTSLGKTDEHAGFVSYTDNIDNVKALGFWSLGENSTYGYRLTGVHLIEWVYAADEGHNSNQLNSQWSHVGIGVDGNQTDLIFGGNKM